MYPRGEIKVSFPVAAAFKGEKEYQTNTKNGESVQEAVKNAQKIVTDHIEETDEEKLRSYKKEICGLVSYNEDTAGASYGNPWQLIWVFDKDEKTNVVCEGYAKAFKYLCDQSSFNGNIRCITVTGTMSDGKNSERHMWNVVLMDDGCNYLADLTNCDGDSDDPSIGYPDKLFLTGSWIEKKKNGYVFQCDTGSVSY